MRHQDLTINHIVESWSFANTAARLAAGAYVSADIGRIGFQQDTGVYWRLTGTAPNWQKFNGTYSTVETANLSASSTTSATLVYMGLGSSTTFTPLVTGKVVVFAVGGAKNDTAGANGGQLQLYYGTIPAPAFGVAAPGSGTVVAPPLLWRNSADSSGCIFPFTLVGFVTGLTIGTVYWFDIALSSGGTTGTVNIAQTHFSITELS